MSQHHLSLTTPGLVLLVGPSGAGKSTFAARHFLPTEVVSSDACRALVGDAVSDQSVTGLAFELVRDIVDKRLQLGRLTVVDATNVKPEDRKVLVELARARDWLTSAIVFDLPLTECLANNKNRTDRHTPEHAIKRQHRTMRRSRGSMKRERFTRVYTLRAASEVDEAIVERVPVWNDRRSDAGPFDLIGDVHGCDAELVELLTSLGYRTEPWLSDKRPIDHPEGRRAVFLGDLVDRGPGSDRVLELVMAMVAAGTALCIQGNHENKLVRALSGRNVKVSHGLAETLAQLEARPADFTAEAKEFMADLVSHYVLDRGRLVVAHAGLPAHYHGRTSGRVRSFALHGDTTGETDEFGLPVRYPWADDYRGEAAVVYGHTPVPEAVWHNNTICLDTGCVFGGELTALRWPERELVAVPAAVEYYEPTRPLTADNLTADNLTADNLTADNLTADNLTADNRALAGGGERPALLLDVEDVLGTHRIETTLAGRLTIEAERSSAAIEVMSRFAVDPRWLCYLPPTMAPVGTSNRPDFLEHPDEALGYYRGANVNEVVCQEKHMGSRIVAIVAASPEAGARRFGVANDAGGVLVTRTGRPFFAEPRTTAAVIGSIRDALTVAGWWDRFETDWIAIDGELLPWSVKAGQLLTGQYAPTGAAGIASLAAANDALRAAEDRGIDLAVLAERSNRRAGHLGAYTEAYGQYCWEVDGADGIRLAPFQLLAVEGDVLARRSHRWQLETIDELVAAAPKILQRTERRVVALDDQTQIDDAVEWWLELTERGGEGMVVKPVEPIVVGERGLVLPGLKCRGREYLRIIYGPEYLEEANLDRLRSRGLGRKSSLARREFALGIEALDRFVAREHLYRVHQCVFAVLALESEPVDPRL